MPTRKELLYSIYDEAKVVHLDAESFTRKINRMFNANDQKRVSYAIDTLLFVDRVGYDRMVRLLNALLFEMQRKYGVKN